jgi:hypothetical protein
LFDNISIFADRQCQEILNLRKCSITILFQHNGFAKEYSYILEREAKYRQLGLGSPLRLPLVRDKELTPYLTTSAFIFTRKVLSNVQGNESSNLEAVSIPLFSNVVI